MEAFSQKPHDFSRGGVFTWLQRLFQTLFGRPDAPPSPRSPPHPRPTPPPGPVEGAVLAQLNFERGRLGLAPLIFDDLLAEVARDWADRIAGWDDLDFEGAARRVCDLFPDRPLGVIVARGQPDARSVVESWMTSPQHRSRILGDFTIVGLSRAMTVDQQPYWCACFVR